MAEDAKRQDDDPKNADEVATLIVGWIKAAVKKCEGYTDSFMFDEEYALAFFRFVFGYKIEQQLKAKRWKADSTRLEEVATQHGRLLFTMAKIRNHSKIELDDVKESMELVQKWCKLSLGANATIGQWCEPWP